jgi:hypothetical protein
LCIGFLSEYSVLVVVCIALVSVYHSKIFIAPSILNDSLPGYRILRLKLFSFSAQNASLYALLAFKVSVEKSAVTLIGLPLYVT